MKTNLIKVAFVVLAFLYSCNSGTEAPTPDKIIGTYFEGLNKSDFKTIESCISDSLLTMEAGFMLSKNRGEYYVHFQWDSVFSPEYKVLASRQISDSTYEVSISKFCKRISYLHDSATVYKSEINFANSTITKINNTELVVFDTLKWATRRDTLVNWIKINQPDLDGFVYDQTTKGAQNYLQAIELFRNRN